MAACSVEDFDVLIFDMDGVVVDTEAQHAEAEQAICLAHEIMIPVSEWSGFRGKRSEEMFRYILERFAPGRELRPEVLAEEAREAYLQLVGEAPRPIPGALGFIRQVHRKYEALALTTSSVARVQQHIFRALRLDGLFSVIVTGDGIKQGKPHAEPYLKTVELLGVPAARCAVIEDSDNGIRSAAAAGCFPIGITTSFSAPVLQQAGARLVVRSFDELAHIL